jgi:nucleoid-associated protein YgaU
MNALKSNKLLIRNLDTKPSEELAVQYNPERYSIERSATWEEQGKGAELQFGGTGRKSITLELFFDTYAEQQDVREAYVNKLLTLMQPTVSTSAGKKRPPVLMLSWGLFTFQGVLEKLAQTYTLFTLEGLPVRAVVNATFKQFTTPTEEARGNPPGDPSKIHRVTQGETLALIAAKEYGNPSLWRVIANENRLTNPRALVPGDSLRIPPLL